MEVRIGGQSSVRILPVLGLLSLAGLVAAGFVWEPLSDFVINLSKTRNGVLALAGFALTLATTGIWAVLSMVRHYPVFVVLKPEGVEVPGHALQSWDAFDAIERTGGDLTFRGGDVATDDVFAPMNQGRGHARKVQAFLKKHAPTSLTASL